MTSSILLACLIAGMISAPAPGSSPIRVNEMAAGTTGFIELSNTGNAAVDIGGWVIRSCRNGKTTPLATFPLGTELPANAFFLVVGRDFTGTAERLLFAESIDSSGATLRDANGARIDGVGFTDNSPCREGTPSEQCAYSSLGRDALSRDTDDNATDFKCQLTTPDQANEMAPSTGGHRTET